MQLGEFENHTKGIGRKLMLNQGWIDGHGLGSKSQGLPMLNLWQKNSVGKASDDRRGIGYSGAKRKSWVFSSQGSRDPKPYVLGRALMQA